MPGAPRSEKSFFGLHLYLAGKYCKNPKVPGAQLSVNPAWEITRFVGLTIYCIFFNNNLPLPRQFLCNKILLKRNSYSKGNANWTNFELRGPGSLCRICTPITDCFRDKTIISKKNIRMDWYLLLKYCRWQCALLPPAWAKSLTKFYPKMQDFKRALDLNCTQKENWTT